MLDTLNYIDDMRGIEKVLYITNRFRANRGAVSCCPVAYYAKNAWPCKNTYHYPLSNTSTDKFTRFVKWTWIEFWCPKTFTWMAKAKKYIVFLCKTRVHAHADKSVIVMKQDGSRDVRLMSCDHCWMISCKQQQQKLVTPDMSLTKPSSPLTTACIPPKICPF